MDLKKKYQKDYILLAGLRKFIEDGTLVASLNYWRDSFQNFKEFEAIDNREDILKSNPSFLGSEFLVAFVKEDFPIVEDEIPVDIIDITFSIIQKHEGVETANITKLFLIEYATSIAKASKEDWLAFIGLADSISDQEELFLKQLKSKFYSNK